LVKVGYQALDASLKVIGAGHELSGRLGPVLDAALLHFACAQLDLSMTENC
jgi:hypothetical protein